jgi:hypothetical protein
MADYKAGDVVMLQGQLGNPMVIMVTDGVNACCMERDRSLLLLPVSGLDSWDGTPEEDDEEEDETD